MAVLISSKDENLGSNEEKEKVDGEVENEVRGDWNILLLTQSFSILWGEERVPRVSCERKADGRREEGCFARANFIEDEMNMLYTLKHKKT